MPESKTEAEKLHDDVKRRCWEGEYRRLETERAQPSSVACSDWVAELEAALSQLMKAGHGQDTRDGRRNINLTEAIRATMDALRAERSRSATDKRSDGR